MIRVEVVTSNFEFYRVVEYILVEIRIDRILNSKVL